MCDRAATPRVRVETMNRTDPAAAVRSTPAASDSGGPPARCCTAPMSLALARNRARGRSSASAIARVGLRSGRRGGDLVPVKPSGRTDRTGRSDPWRTTGPGPRAIGACVWARASFEFYGSLRPPRWSSGGTAPSRVPNRSPGLMAPLVTSGYERSYAARAYARPTGRGASPRRASGATPCVDSGRSSERLVVG